MLTRLFEPIKIGNVQLKNRTVFAAVESYLGDIGISLERAQFVSDRLIRWYMERAEGGVGLITTGASLITPYFPEEPPYDLGLYSPRHAPGLRELTSAIHSTGTPIFVQVFYRGFAPLKIGGPVRIVARSFESPTTMPVDTVSASDFVMATSKPRPLSVPELHEIAGLIGKAARFAREVGFDGMCYNFSIAGLENQFISPLTNRRTDEYGGSLENRMRFPLELIEATHEYAGNDFPILVRIGQDFMDGGLKFDETKQYAPMLEKAGVAALSVIGGWHVSPIPIFQASVPRGVLVDMASQIHQLVKIPVAASHRINSPELAEQILAEGKADLIELGRPLIADPQFVNKAREGRSEDIRKCIACCRCFDMLRQGQSARCTVNPRAGREMDYDSYKPPAKSKKVFIVGGGVAGLEAAATAASRGHKVTVVDRRNALGGQLLVAMMPPLKEELKTVVDYSIAQSRKHGIEVRLNEEATAGSIARTAPDVVIIATGAKPMKPPIPGIDKPIVADFVEILTGTRQVPNSAIVIGGGSVGCEVAEFLAEKGKKITIVEMLPRIAADMTHSNRWVILQRLRKMGITMKASAKVEAITDTGVTANVKGTTESIEGDIVIIAAGLRADRKLYDELKDKVKELYLIGDSLEPQRIGEAVYSAFRTAMRL